MNFCQTLEQIPNDYVLKVFADRDIRVTGAELRRRSAVYASWLQKQGYKTIGIHMGNCPEFLYLFAGALQAGVRVRLFNVLKEAKGDFPIFDRDTAAALLPEHSGTSPDFKGYEWKPDETILEMDTSGTSGQSRTIAKSMKDSVGYLFTESGVRPILRFVAKKLRVKIYNCLPWYHLSGLTLLLLPLCGMCLTEITAEKFNPNTMRKYLNDLRPNLVAGTPTMLQRCVQSGDVYLPPYLSCGGEALSGEALKLFESCKGRQILYNTYGATEAGGISVMLYAFQSIKPSAWMIKTLMQMLGFGGQVFNHKTLEPYCVGTIKKNAHVRIMKDGHEAEEGTTGEIWVQTPTTLSDYGDHYFYTGDLGFRRGNLLYVTGRERYVINRSGEKILPSEIESVLAGFEGVNAAVVFGVPSATHGEDVCAVIESKNGEPVIDKERLSGVLPRHMIPQRLLFLDKIPLNASGKKDVQALRELAMHAVQGPESQLNGTDGRIASESSVKV